MSNTLTPRPARRHCTLSLLSGVAALTLIAPGLAQAQTTANGALSASLPSDAPRLLAQLAPDELGADGAIDAAPRAILVAQSAPAGARPSAKTAAAPLATNRTLAPIPFAPPAPRTLRVSKVDAARAYPLVNRAAKALQAGDTARALDLYRQAYQIDPTNPYAAPGVGTSLIIQGNFKDAAQTFRNYLVVAPDNAKTLRGLADALTYSKQYREALGVNNFILARNPRDFAALYQNAQITTYAGDYAQSETFFSRASGVKSNDPDFYATWGESLSYRRNPRALNAFNRALQLRPGFTRATQGIADYYAYTSQFGKAIEPLQTVLTRDPNNVEALVALGNAYAYSDQPGKAVDPYQRALALAPNSVEARLGLGRALVFSGQSARGATELRRVLASLPGNAEALEGLAIAQNTLDPRAAIESYQTLLSRTQNSTKRAQILASIGDLQLGQNNLSAAAQSYATATKLAPRDSNINLSYAQILGYQGDYAAAGPVVERVLAAQPTNPRALALQLQVAAKSGDSARADQLAQNLANVTPATAQDALALADALRDAGNSEAAQTFLARASQLSKDPALSLRIANATRDAGDYAGAVTLYNSLLTANPHSVDARLGLARTLFYQHQLDAAQGQADQVLAANPNSDDALLLRAEVALARGTAAGVADAAQSAGTLLTRDPNNPAANTLNGNILTAQQQFSAAIEQFQKVLATNPNNLEARLGLARNLYYARRVDESIAQYQQVIALAPADTLPRLELAQIFLDRNRLSDAETLFNEVLTLQQRGLAAVPAARRARDKGDLARLAPGAKFGSPLRVSTLALAKLAPGVRSLAQHGALANLKVADTNASGVQTSGNVELFDGAMSAPNASADSALEEAQSSGVQTSAEAAHADKARPFAARVSAPDASAPRVILAQAASPTIGPGGTPGASAPPAASFPQGPIIGTPTAPAAPAQGEATAPVTPPIPVTPPLPNTVPVAPIAPAVPPLRVPDATFATPLLPGATVNNSISDQVAALEGLGEIRLRQSRYAEAIEFFDRALGLGPNSVSTRVGRARALRGQRNFTDALAEVDRGLTVNPNDLRARVLRAQLLADSGQPAQAQQELDALIGSLPEDAPLDTLLTLVEALNSLKNYTASLQLLDVAGQLYPRETAPLRLKAETLNFAGRTDESLALYDQLIALDPNDGDAILGKARAYNYSNRLPESETTYRQALAVQPENYQAATELADVLGRRGNYPDAIALYTLAIQGNPSDLATRVELARVQRYAGQDAAAEATLTQVLEADARNVSALTERGILRGAQGSYAPAIADLQQALAIAPNDQTALLGLAEVQGYAGDYQNSIVGYREVLAGDPTNLKARTELGLVLSYAGQDAAALGELNTVLTSSPNNITARLAKADILARGGKINDAVAIYNAVLSADARNARARAGLANAYVSGRRYTDAIRVYDQLIAAEPTNTSYRIARARALGYNGQYAVASSALQKIIVAEPGNVSARLAFAEVGTTSGDPKLRGPAIAEYRRIVAAEPSNIPARVGLGRALSYQGDTKAATQVLNQVLVAQPNNTEARLALGEAQRFAGLPFEARNTYKQVLKTDPNNATAKAGLAATKRATSTSIGVSGSFYNDTNGVRLRSLNYGPTFRTRAGLIGIIAEQGQFKQGPFRANRDNYGVFAAKAFGPYQLNIAASNVRYSGASNRFLYDVNLGNTRNARQRYFIGTGRRDVYESAQAVVQKITATTYRAGFTYPLAPRFDLEGQAVYYNYSDNNSRITAIPSVYYRFRATNPSLRVGLGYTYDDSRRTSNIYYAPQNYNALTVLADYVYDIGRTRFGINGAVPLTNSTGRNGINRPANTLFGFIAHDVSPSLELFANGGIVRSSDFHSDQVTFGGNLFF